jgi:hypothetical protein
VSLPRRVLAVAVVLLAACGRDDDGVARAVTSTSTTSSSPPTTTTTTTTTVAPAPIEIRLRIERLATDDATSTFADVVLATLSDPRGWARAGFTFSFGDDAPYTILLAEGPEVDARCAPYDTGGRYSCQHGPVVALNADRWRGATPQWTSDRDAYRQMLVNHEVGHLLGQHHVVGGCTTPGAPAPIMVQQSTNLDGCLANPWPLDWEIECAAQRLEPLAPPYEPDATPICGRDV